MISKSTKNIISSKKFFAFIIAIAIFIIITASIFANFLNPYWIQIIQFACIITISALGLNLIYGYTGQFSLGHAAFFGIGAYSSALVTKTFHGLGFLSFIFGLITAIIIVAIIALLIGLPILRLKSDYLGIATLGFGIIVKVLFDNADAVIPALGGSRGMLGIPQFTVFPLTYLFFVITIVVIRNFVFSDVGRSCISIREDDIAADCVGVNTTKYKTIGFVFGSIFAGVAGVLYAHLYSFLHPSNFDFLKSIDVLLIVVLGGLGSISGTIIAAIAWTFLLEGLRVILPPQILDWRLVIYPLVLIIIMLIRPMGIGSGMEFAFIKPEEKEYSKGNTKQL